MFAGIRPQERVRNHMFLGSVCNLYKTLGPEPNPIDYSLHFFVIVNRLLTQTFFELTRDRDKLNFESGRRRGILSVSSIAHNGQSC